MPQRIKRLAIGNAEGQLNTRRVSRHSVVQSATLGHRSLVHSIDKVYNSFAVSLEKAIELFCMLATC